MEGGIVGGVKVWKMGYIVCRAAYDCVCSHFLVAIPDCRR